MRFKAISYLELWQPFCLAERNHLYILVEGIKRKILRNYFELGSVVQMFFLKKKKKIKILSGALATLLFSGADPFIQF